MTGSGLLRLLAALISLLAALGALLYAAERWRSPQHGAVSGETLTRLLGPSEERGFALPLQPRPFVFPQDHQPHDAFRSEWWYFTGNLEGDAVQSGYQLTFFRQALLSPLEQLEAHSRWSARYAWMAHFAVSDLSSNQGGGRFFQRQKLARQALGLAGSRTRPAPFELELWAENWRMRWQDERTVQIQAGTPDFGLSLQLTSLKPPVLQGQRGLSLKGPRPGQSSYYYSWTRLASRGQLRLPGRPMATVRGWSWMDREWSSRSLGRELAGWDWFSFQFEDGQELMYYQLRRHDGRPTRFSAGSRVDARGHSQPLPAGQVQLSVLGSWRSPQGGTRYPARWKLRLADGTEIEVEPRLADQEWDGLTRYWEGAVRVRRRDPNGRSVSGFGYAELVGYAGSTPLASLSSDW